MIPLYTQEQFDNAKSTDKLPCQCYQCQNTFYLAKHAIRRVLNPNHLSTGMFCSIQCNNVYNHPKNQSEINCSQCGLIIYKSLGEKKQSKSGNHFCSLSCAASFNNKHKSHGTRRSKLEIYLEQQLTLLYPNLDIHFNKKDAIGSELDIYIPSLSLAFELNGIFHYEPIYGNNKLDQIQNNDQNKFKLCQENKIDLCIIDTSGQKYFKASTSKKYLDIIIKIIENK